jgi:hypothetical protein
VSVSLVLAAALQYCALAAVAAAHATSSGSERMRLAVAVSQCCALLRACVLQEAVCSNQQQ